jgi:hypothetical protein
MKTTTDHDEIRLWAQAHDGHPEIIDEVEAGNAEPQLRINFPGLQDDVFLSENTPEKSLSWEEFFQKFDHFGLAFEYDEKIEGTDVSNAYRFINKALLHK